MAELREHQEAARVAAAAAKEAGERAGNPQPKQERDEREESGSDLSAKELQRRAAAEKETNKPKTLLHLPKGQLWLETESAAPGGRGCWFARTPHDHTIEDVLQPHYFGLFQHEEGGLQAGDIIVVEPESGLWYTQLRVMARVPKLSHVKVREMSGMRQYYGVKSPPGVKFEWRGAQAKWVIVKGAVDVDGGFDSQDEALACYERLSKEKVA